MANSKSPKRQYKWLIITLYTLVVVCIGIATIIEKYRGTAFVGEHIYGAWWFSALWGVLTVVACAYFIRQRLYKRFAVMLLHVAFVVILAGALVTHLCARQGTVTLLTNIPEISYADKDNMVHNLPFSLTLKEFRIINYPGTEAPLDYQSIIQSAPLRRNASEHNITTETIVSMNHIGNINGYRLFQRSYNSDGQGVTLGVSYDPYGIAITYLGYLLLLLGFIATLLSRHTQMRSLYRKAFAAALLLVSISANANNAQSSTLDPLPSVDEEIAHRLGTVLVLYNDRICPLNTVATDFAIKMTGSASWHGYSADEIFFSWMIYYMPWEKELLQNNTKRKGAEERNAVVEMFYNGQFTKIFPYRQPSTLNSQLSTVNWYSPGRQVLPREIPVKEQFFIKQAMDFLTEAIVTGQRDRAIEIIEKIKFFQSSMIGELLPSEHKVQAELIYNKLRSIKFPVFITLQLGLRWWLSGHIPLSNGYETMLFMAWVLLVLTVILFRRVRIILFIGPLAALCCLLVAMMSGSSAQLTPLMPVLQSPLLSIHVMTVMCAYAIFALQMLLGVYVLIRMKKSNSQLSTRPEGTLDPSRTFNSQLSTFNFQLQKLTALSGFMLYPAVFLLTAGIFLGAVWANISWGNYWSWDPKETWALITLMVYAVPLHTESLTSFRNPRLFHIYMVAAFLAVIITYFGVNYFLGGMHSYA